MAQPETIQLYCAANAHCQRVCSCMYCTLMGRKKNEAVIHNPCGCEAPEERYPYST